MFNEQIKTEENEERICAREHLNNYNQSLTNKEKTLFILDRGYPKSDKIFCVRNDKVQVVHINF